MSSADTIHAQRRTAGVCIGRTIAMVTLCALALLNVETTQAAHAADDRLSLPSRLPPSEGPRVAARTVHPASTIAADPLVHGPILAGPLPGEHVVPGSIVYGGDLDSWQADDFDLAARPWLRANQPWSWHVLPEGLIYNAYMAGVKESRMSTVVFHHPELGTLWDATLGGRFGLVRYGTGQAWRPDGWQIDVEGSAQPRLNVEEDVNLVSTDFRAGVMATRGEGAWQTKYAYYHLSSHLGDEYLLTNPQPRINFSRDVLVVGLSWRPDENWRLYGEAGWAFRTDGGSQPWETQFGVELTPQAWYGPCGGPFMAVNAMLREEVDWGGSLTAQLGWLIRGTSTDRTLRVGVHYFTGKSSQYEFFDDYEEQIGIGTWYDF